MTRVLINVSGTLYASGIELALKKNGNFRTAVLRSGDPEQVLTACREQKAEVLLLGVTPMPGFTVRERRELIAHLRRELPACRLVLIVDDSVSEDVNEDVKTLKQTGVIDAFVDSVLAGKPSPVEGSDAIRAMQVIFAAERSAIEGRAVEVNYDV